MHRVCVYSALCLVIFSPPKAHSCLILSVQPAPDVHMAWHGCLVCTRAAACYVGVSLRLDVGVSLRLADLVWGQFEQLVMLDIPDSGAYYVFDGDNIDSEMLRSFIGLPSPPPHPSPCLKFTRVLAWLRVVVRLAWCAEY